MSLITLLHLVPKNMRLFIPTPSVRLHDLWERTEIGVMILDMWSATYRFISGFYIRFHWLVNCSICSCGHEHVHGSLARRFPTVSIGSIYSKYNTVVLNVCIHAHIRTKCTHSRTHIHAKFVYLNDIHHRNWIVMFYISWISFGQSVGPNSVLSAH